MTAYRNDVDALAARDKALARELADKQRERADVQRLLEEARAAEAAEAEQRDVMVGRRRLRRVAVGLAALIAAGVAAGAVFVHRCPPARHADEVNTLSQINVDETRYELALAAKGLTRVELEPRFVGGLHGFATASEVDAVLGQPVEPWQQFTYTHDASVRQAIASPLFHGGDFEPAPELVSDGYGGVWRVLWDIPRTPGRVPAASGWARRVWLLPVGSVYRGDVQIAYPR
jgi:hypothetical protein